MKSFRSLQHGVLRELLSSQSHVAQATLRQTRYNTQSTFRTRPVQRAYSSISSTSSPLHSRIKFPNPSRRFRRSESTQSTANDANLSLSQRLRKLSREYGWSALGVYLLLTALDFPFCFAAVRMLGTDRIGHWEHVALSHIKAWVKWPLPTQGQEVVDGAVDEVKGYMKEVVPIEEVRDGEKRILEEGQTIVVEDHGYAEAEKANRGDNASKLNLFVDKESRLDC